MKNVSKLLIPGKYNIESFWKQVWVVSWNISMLSAMIRLWKNSLWVTTHRVGRQMKRRMMGKHSAGWREEDGDLPARLSLPQTFMNIA